MNFLQKLRLGICLYVDNLCDFYAMEMRLIQKRSPPAEFLKCSKAHRNGSHNQAQIIDIQTYNLNSLIEIHRPLSISLPQRIFNHLIHFRSD